MNCPKCNYDLQCHTSIFDEDLKPKKGDYSVCFKCGTILKFKGDMNLEIVSTVEIVRLYLSDINLFGKLYKIRDEIINYQAKKN